MFRARWFVAVVSLPALLLSLWTAGPAAANQPTHIFYRSIGFVCSDVRTSGGVVQISAEQFSDFETPDVSISYWVPPETPENAPGSTYRSSSLITEQHVTLTGYRFEGSALMEDRDF